MRFQKSIGYPRSEWRPPRGPCRKRYRMSEKALTARRGNLDTSRGAGKIKLWRCLSESKIIKLLIWQAQSEENPPTERALARQLGVWPSYVHKVKQRVTSKGLYFGRCVTLDDLAEAQLITARIREREPYLFAPQPRQLPCTSSDPTPASAVSPTDSVSAATVTPHPPGCKCKVCVCPRCEKYREARTSTGYIVQSWERCICVEHPKDCGCPRCRIERIVTKHSPVATSE